MISLLRKDFIVGWTALLGILALIPFLISMALWVMIDDFGGIILPVFTGITFIIILFFSFIIMMVEAGAKSEIIFASLPVSRPTIVLARYISSFILIAYNLAIISLTILMQRWLFSLDDPAFPILLDIRGILFMLGGFILILSFIFPFMYKFGVGKGALAGFSLGIGIPLFIPVIKFIYRALQGVFVFDLTYLLRFTQSIINWMTAQSAGIVYLIFVSTLSLVVFISLVTSMHFYNKLDL